MASDIYSALAAAQTPQNLFFRRMLEEGTNSAPIQHWTQGASRMANALMAGLAMRGMGDDEGKKFDTMFPAGPAMAAAPAAAPAASPVAAALAGPQPDGDIYGKAIAANESGGNYKALGPVIPKSGDRAYGKYQVMGANIGPCTEEVLGRPMSAEEFVMNPQVQDAVFKRKFGEYTQKYGPEGAARAWFAGEGGMNDPNRKDVLGTSVAQYGQKFVQNAGLPTGDATTPPNAQPTQGYVIPGQPQAGQPGQRQAPQIPPDVHARARAMWMSNDPALKQAAVALLQPYLTPKDQVRPMTDEERVKWKVPDGVSAGINAADGKPVFSQPANSVNVNTVANPVLEGVGKQIVDQRKAASAAVNSIPMLHEARAALDQGAITGQAADLRLTMAKVGNLFGLTNEQVANTEVFKTAIGNQVLGHIKELGANPSNADRDYIEKVQGGQIALDEKSLRRILDINEKYSRQAIKNFNRDADKLMGTDPRAYSSIAPLMRMDEPPEYKAPPPKAPAAPQGGGVRRFNPATGKIE